MISRRNILTTISLLCFLWTMAGCSVRKATRETHGAALGLLTKAEVQHFVDEQILPTDPFAMVGTMSIATNGGKNLTARMELRYIPDKGMTISIRPIVFYEALRAGIRPDGITVIDNYGEGYLQISWPELAEAFGMPISYELWLRFFFGKALDGAEGNVALLPEYSFQSYYKPLHLNALYQLTERKQTLRKVRYTSGKQEADYALTVYYPEAFVPYARGKVPTSVQFDLEGSDALRGTLQLTMEAPKRCKPTLPTLSKPNGYTTIKLTDLIKLLS